MAALQSVVIVVPLPSLAHMVGVTIILLSSTVFGQAVAQRNVGEQWLLTSTT